MKVVFLHPDFGIGGAERLVLDEALAMKKKQHDVRIVTNQFSKDHCFTELLEFKENNTLEVVGQSLPRTLLGKCYALCAYIRFCVAALYVCFNHPDADVIICDQISAPLPILHLCSKASLVFYCHYPDQLLTDRKSSWKKIYRVIIDQIESWTMIWAHRILVNSHFTAGVVHDTFPALADRPLTILYPSINCEFFEQTIKHMEGQKAIEELTKELGPKLVELLEHEDTIVFLSINRFERKKNIELAIRAFEDLIHGDFLSVEESDRCVLVIAGGYDSRNAENINHYRELEALIKSLALEDRVKFVKSPSDNAKIWLMDLALLVVYTPDREHFGIVPIEAMFLSTPVLAVNSGGPKETVVQKETGFLREAEPQFFAESMAIAVENQELMEEYGVAGRRRVEENFSFDAFADTLHNLLVDLRTKQQGNTMDSTVVEEEVFVEEKQP